MEQTVPHFAMVFSMADNQLQLLSEIQPEQLALIDQLDARQDEVLKRLDDLTFRIEQIIELYLQNRDTEQTEQENSESGPSDEQRNAA